MTTANINVRRRKHRDIAFPIANTCILILLCFITLYPVLNTVAYSFNNGLDAVKGGIGLLPRKFSTEAYTELLQDPAVYKAFWISLSKTVITTLTTPAFIRNADRLFPYSCLSTSFHRIAYPQGVS